MKKIYHRCANCAGIGYVRYQHKSYECPVCQGTGKIEMYQD